MKHALRLIPLSFLLLPAAAAAEGRSITLSTGFNMSLTDILGNVVKVGAEWISGFCVMLFLIGAFLMVINAGKEERAKMGQSLVISSLIGLGVTLGAAAIVQTVLYVIY